MSDQFAEKIAYANKIIGSHTEVVKITTRYLLLEMSAEVAMAEIQAILRKEIN
jgi:hypothetical protein